MRKMDPFKISSHRPTCIGTGLLVLDVVLNGHATPLIGAGGSCGNVLSILSSLGWNAYPLARIGNDVNSRLLIADLKKWRVKTSHITRERGLHTPIIIERLIRDHPGLTHTFAFKCPDCGSDLPKNKRVNEETITKSRETTAPEVFYFDRVSNIILSAAKERKAQGALIVFEPCSHRIRDSFYEAVKLADIVKYSSEEFEDHISIKSGQLEIQTLGAKGAKFRLHRKDASGEWKFIDPYELEKVVDTAGAGDLCTAGIIHYLGQKGKEGFLKAPQEKIEESIKFGQALALLGCSFRGARGHMYNLTKGRIRKLTVAIMNNKVSRVDGLDVKRWNRFRYHCPYCEW